MTPPQASAMAPEATGDDGSLGSAMEPAAQSKPRKRKKSRPPRPPPPSSMEGKPTKWKKVASSSTAAGPATPSPPSGGDSSGDGQQQLAAGDGQQQRGKPRVVWSEELHDIFLKAYNILGEDAVPKKILALMNVDGITRENVASHLQKYRLSLKQEEKRIPHNEGGDERPTVHAEAFSSQTPLPTTPPQAQAQAQEPPPDPSSLHAHTLPPQPEAPFAALRASSQLQVGQHHGQQLLLQTPPADCFGVNTTATDWLLGPGGVPMTQPIQQQRVAPPPEATVAARRELFKKQEEAARQAEMASMMRYEEAEEIAMAAQLGTATEGEDGQGQVAAEMGAKAGDGQGLPAEPEAAEMAAAGPEEGQGRGGEPAGAAAPAGSGSPPGSSSIHERYWKIDDAEVSWDFGFLWYKTG